MKWLLKYLRDNFKIKVTSLSFVNETVGIEVYYKKTPVVSSIVSFPNRDDVGR